MYETGCAVQFESFHVMPGLPPPEGERHSHDYRVDVVVSRDDLDDRGMVVDLDVLGGGLQALAELLGGADLDRIVGPEMGTDAVTVEVFARWVHERLGAALGALPGATLRVRVWESPTAFGGYGGALDGRSNSV
jgi:6-pyruvoyltetrahydropterin/6-carboxytetrahydropterin synthase